MRSGGTDGGTGRDANGHEPGHSPFGPLELPPDETEVLPRFDEYADGPGGPGGYAPPPSGFPPPPTASPYVPPRPAHTPPGGAQAPAPPADPADATQAFPAAMFRDGAAGGPPPGPPAPRPYPPQQAAPPQYGAYPAPREAGYDNTGRGNTGYDNGGYGTGGYGAAGRDNTGYDNTGYGGTGHRPPADPPGGQPSRLGGDTGRSRTPLIAGGVGIIVVIAAVGVFASGAFGEDEKGDKAASGISTSASVTATGKSSAKPGTAPSPKATPKPTKTVAADPTGGQAAAVDKLLTSGAGSRQVVSRAVQKIQSCSDPAAGARELTAAAKQRDQQIAGLASLKTDKLTRGPALVAALRDAWKASAESDRELAAWGNEMARGGCRDKHADSTAHKRAADSASGKATTAKGKAVALWNPIADTTKLKKRSAGGI